MTSVDTKFKRRIHVSKSLGRQIANIRFKKKMTLEEFGKLFNPPASHSLVSRWERNINKPNRQRLKRLSELGDIEL